MDEFRRAGDADLIAAVTSDPAALEELYRRYRRIVLAYGARRCEQSADVDDLITATFLGAVESAASYDPRRGAAAAWLIGIAHNQLGLLRRQQLRQHAVAVAVASRRELSDHETDRLEEQIDAVRASAEVRGALRKLPPRQREALLLVSEDELTRKEAAAVVGVSPAAFRVRLFRARRAAQVLLASPSHKLPPLAPKEVDG